jgi:hypothetical protein
MMFLRSHDLGLWQFPEQRFAIPKIGYLRSLLIWPKGFWPENGALLVTLNTTQRLWGRTNEQLVDFAKLTGDVSFRIHLGEGNIHGPDARKADIALEWEDRSGKIVPAWPRLYIEATFAAEAEFVPRSVLEVV